MHQQTSSLCVLAVLLALASCCLGESVSPTATTINATSTKGSTKSTPTSTPAPIVPTTHEMPPLIFPKEKASATNTSILDQRRLNQTQVIFVSNNPEENESKAKGPAYQSPETDKSAVAVDTNPSYENQYETHPGPSVPLNPIPHAEVSSTGATTQSTPASSEPSHEARVQKPTSSLGRMPFLEPSKSAAILAGILASVALFGYVGLFMWRRLLERRYGNREMLVNDDDCYDASDPKNFEL